MVRAPFQVLVLPYRTSETGELEFAIFRRSDADCWQGIAGGGEDDETPLCAATREAWEESGISPVSRFVPLDTTSSVPVTAFPGNRHWGNDRYVITEHAFGVDASGQLITLSSEHTEHRWMPYADAHRLLTFDGNRTALWELNQKLSGRNPQD